MLISILDRGNNRKEDEAFVKRKNKITEGR